MKLTSTFVASIAAAVALAASHQPAEAATVTGLYGGGSTLAEKVYRDLFNNYGSTSNGDLCTGLITVCPTTSYNSSAELLYVGVGSGNGVKALDAYNPLLYTTGNKKPDGVPVTYSTDLGGVPYYGTGTSAATWTPVAGSTVAYPSVTFSGSDNVLGSSDVAAVAALGFGPVIQLPGIVAAIAVPFHPTASWNPKGAQPAGASSKVQLSLNTVCGIFTGAITDWSDPAIKKDNKNIQLGSGPITVVYRNDSSGTTFLFSNALLNQCGTQSHPAPNSTHPVPDAWVNDSGLTYSTTAPHWLSGTSFFIKAFNDLPPNFLNNPTLTGVTGGASGSGGVQAAILSVTGSIGYISPDFVQPVDAAGPQAANLQTYLSFSTGSTAFYKAPTAANATPIMASIKPPVFTGSPVPAANPLNWGAVNPTPSGPGAYPIGGFSFIDLYSCYSNPAVVAALVGSTAGSVGIPASVLANNGFAPVPPSWAAAVNTLVGSPIYGIGSPKVGKAAGTRACKTVTKGA
jgi:ABC-type phosphate transport system substrate-binding protein